MNLKYVYIVIGLESGIIHGCFANEQDANDYREILGFTTWINKQIILY